MSTTVPLHGRVYDLGSEPAAQEAQVWINENLGDTSRFETEFPQARVLASVFMGARGLIKYEVIPSAADTGNGWEPVVRVPFVREDGSSGTAMRHFSNLGSFKSVREASEAGSKVQVADIRNDDVVLFVHEQKHGRGSS